MLQIYFGSPELLSTCFFQIKKVFKSEVTEIRAWPRTPDLWDCPIVSATGMQSIHWVLWVVGWGSCGSGLFCWDNQIAILGIW